MPRYAIQANGLSKAYRISTELGLSRARYKTLQETIIGTLRRPFSVRGPKTETFWALDDVSFNVEQGQALGVIGRNGAGKSTLLKLLSRITRPTKGRAVVYGRMGSLLEVGTGFHPELTGRENVFLNGAILGMTRADVKRRFDEIVSFAEVERFLDVPVKRYSSGMYMRLAFAVAAHLEPEVLMVDEVLAVGDAEFQKKCLGRMQDVTREGRTVLFVSHNLAAVSQLCTRVLCLEAGHVRREGPADQVISDYLSRASQDGRVTLHERGRDGPGRGAAFEWVEVRDAGGTVRADFSIGDDIVVAFRVRLAPDRPGTRLGVSIRAADGTPVALVKDEDSGFELKRDRDAWDVEIRFADVRLYPGPYFVSLWAHDLTYSNVFDHASDALQFWIVDGGNLTGRSLARSWGIIFLTPAWRALGVTQTVKPENTVASPLPTGGRE